MLLLRTILLCLPSCPPAHLLLSCHALLCCPAPAAQAKALMVATQLMRGRSLRAALRDPRTQPMLRWAARCALLAAPARMLGIS